MKLYLLALLLCVLGFDTPSFSQDKIEGIGRFKVGKTTVNLIQQIATETGVPVGLIEANNKTEKSLKNQIVEIKLNPSFGRSLPVSSRSNAHARLFYLTNFREEDIELQSVYLHFKDDVLVKFTCYATSKLHKALEIRYGQPEINIVKLYSDCDLDAKNFVLTWHSDTITAVLSLVVNFDGDCQKRVHQEFSMALTEKEDLREGSEGVAKGGVNK